MKTKLFIFSFLAMFLFGMSVVSCSNDDPTDSSGLIIDDDDDDNSNDNNNDDGDGNEDDNNNNNDGDDNGDGNGDSDDDDAIGSTEGLDMTGSDYHIFIMSNGQFNALGDKVVADFRGQDLEDPASTQFMYLWNGYDEGVCTGPNPFGEVKDWFSVVVQQGVTWSGGGLAIPVDKPERLAMTKIDECPEKYYLHMYLKTSQPDWAVVVTLYYGHKNHSSALLIGNQTIDKLQPYMDIEHNGEWQKVEIPISEFYANGELTYKAEDDLKKEVNLISFLSGGVAGRTLDIDACFIYKKAE